MATVLVITEQVEGAFRKVAYEALSGGKQAAEALGCGVDALVMGADVTALAESLGAYGADTVWAADDPALADTFFLGAPLPLGERLYVLAETKGLHVGRLLTISYSVSSLVFFVCFGSGTFSGS